jgi:hypothetical protein
MHLLVSFTHGFFATSNASGGSVSPGTSLNVLRQLPGKLANKQFSCFLIYEVLDCHK